MRVLVTGTTSAIGQSAVTTLAGRGHQVRAMIFRRTRATFAALAHGTWSVFMPTSATPHM